MNTFRAAAALCLAASALAEGGCVKRGGAAPAPAATADENGPRFLTPPSPSSAVRTEAAGVAFAGRALPGATVSLRNPDGAAFSVVAASDGGWTLALPPADLPRLYALSSTGGGPAMRGEGAVLAAPPPAAPGLLLRAGSPAIALGAARGELSLEALDFDAGGLAVAGHADPNAALRLSIDDRPAAAAHADPTGRFALLAVGGDLKAGPHRLLLDDGTRRIEAAVNAAPAVAGPAPYRVDRVENGWRVDWSTPGGGAQSSIVFSPPLTAQIP